MPLPESACRKKMHRRYIDCEGYLRDDRLWDIEAHMRDTRTYDCGYDKDHRGGIIRAGEPVHDMWLQLTIDLDFVIQEAQAASDHTPFEICTRASVEMKALVGLQIGQGWMKRVRERIGTHRSCTHLMDLLGPIAATAYQTLHAALEERERKRSKPQRPMILDTCIALASDGAVVKRRWPEFYQAGKDKI